MFKPTLINRIEKGVSDIISPVMIPKRKRKLVNTDFTIISNNCWGGIVYEWYGLKKNTPTAGVWFFADDYLRFVSNLKYYLSLEIQIIPIEKSKRYKEILDAQSTECPVGVIDDVEVIFLHYKDPIVAKEKWEKRKERVNYDNLIIKFSYMNGCTPDMLQQFENMKFHDYVAKKIMFINKPNANLKSGVYYPGFEKDGQITNDTYFFNKYFDLDKFINEGIIDQKTRLKMVDIL